MESDDDVPTAAFKEGVAASRKGKSPLNGTQVLESKPSAAVEGAIKIFPGQLHTFNHKMELTLGIHGDGSLTSTEHPLVTWLVTWTTDIVMEILNCTLR